METKVKPNLLLVIVKYGLDVVWYLSFVLLVVGVIFIVKSEQDTTVSKENRTFSVEVEYRGKLSEPYLTYRNYTAVRFNPTHGRLELSGGRFPFVIYFMFVLLVSCIFVFLFYLRKIFTSLLRHSPFCMENVKRTRILAYCLVIANILFLVNKWWFIPEITSGTSYPIHLSFNFPNDFKYIFMAMAVYVLADIFKYGFQVQEENNKFI